MQANEAPAHGFSGGHMAKAVWVFINEIPFLFHSCCGLLRNLADKHKRRSLIRRNLKKNGQRATLDVRCIFRGLSAVTYLGKTTPTSFKRNSKNLHFKLLISSNSFYKLNIEILMFLQKEKQAQ